VALKPPLGLNQPQADKSLCWTETVNPRNIPDMDACPDFFNRGGWPPQPVLTLNPIEGFKTTSIVFSKPRIGETLKSDSGGAVSFPNI